MRPKLQRVIGSEFGSLRRALACLPPLITRTVLGADQTWQDALSRMPLTNQAFVRATFRPPLLLMHTDEDGLDGIAVVEYELTALKLAGVAAPDGQRRRLGCPAGRAE